jgi:hypothetical protein
LIEEVRALHVTMEDADGQVLEQVLLALVATGQQQIR